MERLYEQEGTASHRPATLGVEESTRDSWPDPQSSPRLALDGIDLSVFMIESKISNVFDKKGPSKRMGRTGSQEALPCGM